MYGNFGGGYNPYSGQNPYMGNQYMERLQAVQQPAQPTQQIVRVTGMDGAKAYQMPPNSAVTLFDANEDVFFLKSTDGAGFPTIRAFRFAPIETAPAQGEFITRAEFEQFKEAFLNGKQSVQPDSAGTETGGK